MSETHGTVHWSELMTRDVPKALEYYGAVCGWRFDRMPMPEGDYHIGMVGDRPVAGIVDMSMMDEGTPPHWLTYMAVDDADKAVAQTREAGGQIYRDCFDVQGVGRIAIVADPTGAAVGVITPSDEPME
ncbi:VOC family protein [Cognatishimia sp. MH4019]|uniref:VOC family protein n=1 Tax=Cognatishimia sp. MH4019 TaxID=2854030 RepID=UPI001CD1EE98|nr:VOC family protein [Cognatishimia sp. MH4019]